MKLFRSDALPGQWIGEDRHGRLMVWPAEPRGWLKRTAYVGSKRALVPAEPAGARGTGWPGGPTGRKARTGGPSLPSPVTIRVTAEERKNWEQAAKDHGRRLSDWCRDTLNRESARPRSKSKP
jgi:hypothetical protein